MNVCTYSSGMHRTRDKGLIPTRDKGLTQLDTGNHITEREESNKFVDLVGNTVHL